ncbi:GATA transcription factor 5-like [Senna tora]|uniref:GATA transcription factor 5-like n=1 Tax=Senna tora TaxID=362788 RepID=A0A834XGT4_9FABA|nr:GATA transcription factor 5-like [Senna tora]
MMRKESLGLGSWDEINNAMPRRCTHCLAQRTPQWRAGPLGPKTLCNACGLSFIYKNKETKRKLLRKLLPWKVGPQSSKGPLGFHHPEFRFHQARFLRNRHPNPHQDKASERTATGILYQVQICIVTFWGSTRNLIREVHLGFLASNPPCFSIISSSSFFGSVESSKPDTNTLSWVPDLSCPFSPWALTDSPILILPLSLLRLHLPIGFHRFYSSRSFNLPLDRDLEGLEWLIAEKAKGLTSISKSSSSSTSKSSLNCLKSASKSSSKSTNPPDLEGFDENRFLELGFFNPGQR